MCHKTYIFKKVFNDFNEFKTHQILLLHILREAWKGRCLALFCLINDFQMMIIKLDGGSFSVGRPRDSSAWLFFGTNVNVPIQRAWSNVPSVHWHLLAVGWGFNPNHKMYYIHLNDLNLSERTKTTEMLWHVKGDKYSQKFVSLPETS